jgi:hypothetical protein
VKIIKTEFLIRKGIFYKSSEFQSILKQIENAVLSVTHPKDSRQFTLSILLQHQMMTP